MKLIFAGYRKKPWGLHWTDPISGEFLTQWFESPEQAHAFENDEQSRSVQEMELFRRSWRRSAASRAKGLTVADLANRYLALHPLAPVTLRTDRQHLKPLLRLVGRLQARLFDAGDISAVRMAQHLRGVGQTTIAQRVNILRRVFGWAYNESLLPHNPFLGLHLPMGRSRRTAPPSDREANALYQATKTHVRRVIVLGLFLGPRIGPSELFRLPWSNMDLDNGWVRMPTAAKGSNRDARDLPLRQDILPLLRLWADADAAQGIPWVIHWRGKPVRSIAEAWSTAKRRAGITRRLRPYDLRHAFATNALAEGADPGSVAKIMEHRDRSRVLKTYQHVSKRQLVQAVECVPMMLDLDAENIP